VEFRALGISWPAVSALGLGLHGNSRIYGSRDDAESIGDVHIHARLSWDELFGYGDVFVLGTMRSLVVRHSATAAKSFSLSTKFAFAVTAPTPTTPVLRLYRKAK